MQKLNIKLVYPKSRLSHCKIADEKCKLQIAKCVVAKFQQDTCRSSRSQMIFKIDVLKNVCKKTTGLESLFLIKLQHYLKKDTRIGIFLRILRNFEEHLFRKNNSGGYFCTQCNSNLKICDLEVMLSVYKSNMTIMLFQPSMFQLKRNEDV